MEFVKSHIQKRKPERETNNKDLDLDERIRRIKEADKVREKRFKEIEDDKLQASMNGMAMKGVMAVGGKKTSKGRGQRLLEMSKKPLKAKEFELRAREESQKKIEQCNQPEESKQCLTRPPKENKRAERDGYQSKKEKKEILPNTAIPSVGFNPLMDDRYIDKKDVSKRHGDHREGNETKQTRGGQRGNSNGFAGYDRKQDRPKLGEAQSSGWKPVKLNNSQRTAFEEKEKYYEDKSIEVMNVGELKTESIAERKLEVSEQTKKEVSTGSDIHEVDIKNTDLSENTDTMKDNATRHDEHKTVTSLVEICDKFHDQAVLQDNNKVDKNENLPDKYILEASRSNNKEVVTGENDSRQTITAIPEEQEKSFEVKELPSTENTKPKITVNTKMKKTLSNSSFDDSISLLSPLDVPKDWGDCDFDESSSVPSMYYHQTLNFN